jgi:hypothetical protein
MFVYLLEFYLHKQVGQSLWDGSCFIGHFRLSSAFGAIGVSPIGVSESCILPVVALAPKFDSFIAHPINL